MSNKPTHTIFLVRDSKKDGEPARWQRLGSVWPTKAADGYSGPLQLAAPLVLPADGVRIVVQPNKESEDTNDQPSPSASDDDMPF